MKDLKMMRVAVHLWGTTSCQSLHQILSRSFLFPMCLLIAATLAGGAEDPHLQRLIRLHGSG